MYLIVKRFVDTIVDSVFLIILSPLLLIIAIAVKLDSKLPTLLIYRSASLKKNTLKKFSEMEV